MIKKALIWLFMVTTGMAAEPTLYKYTDEDGVTHYSQTKKDERYQVVKSAPITVVPSIEVKARNSSNTESREEVTIADLLADVRLIKPLPEENLWGTGLKVTASIKVDPLVLETHDVQYVIDGKAKPANRKATQVFENIYRGQHEIYGQLVLKGSDRIVKKTQKVTFFMHQTSKK